LKVWQVKVDLHVLDNGGNIADCASIAAITALAHFRYGFLLILFGKLDKITNPVEFHLLGLKWE
jgi:exosome complex RNA-binding protein Rrp42 (RNase PH superfamily)